MKTTTKEKLQEVYDRVKAHLLTQNRRSKKGNQCLYADSNGNKCAIGCLILPEHYNSKLEGMPVSFSELHEALRKSGIDINSENMELFLDCLRDIHDNLDVDVWEFELEKLATEFKLNP